MTESSRTSVSAWRVARFAGLALAIAAPAGAARPALAADSAPEDPAPSDPSMGAPVDAPASPSAAPLPPPSAAPQSSATQPSASPSASAPPPPAVGAPAASVMGPPAPVSGPPIPKSARGKLPDIRWRDAPGQVPPALEEAVHIVTRNYPSVKSARSALRAAAADVRSAEWLRFPTITGDLVYRNSDANPVPQLAVEMPIWSGGRIGAAIKRAEASENVTSAEYVETVFNLSLSTADTYFQIASLTLRQQLLADSLVEHHKLVATMERRVAQEVSPQADLDLARSRAAQMEQEYNQTRAQRDTALRLMAELVADRNYDLGPLPFYDPNITIPEIAGLEDQAVAYNPTHQRLIYEADVARAQLSATKATLFPQFLTQYTYDDFNGSRLGLAVRMQSQAGLSQFSQMESARLAIDAANQRAMLAEQQLRRDIASDIITFEAARERASISRNASDTAARVSASYMRQFIAGRRSWLDVMNALREAVNAQIGRTDAEITALSATVRLLLKSGRWRPTFDNTAN